MYRRLADLVARLPEICEETDISTAKYLRALDFPDSQARLASEEIADAFRHCPQLTDKWLKRAGDQRIMGGWGIEAYGDIYRIYRHGNSFGYLSFADRAQAVAEFAVRYVRFISDALTR